MEYLISGLSAGSVYAMLGLGLVLTYRSTNTLNFAQGEVAMVLAFVCYTLVPGMGIGIVPALLATMLVASLVGAGIYNLVIHPNRRKDHEKLAIITLGVQLTLVGVAAVLWGPQSRVFPSLFPVDHYSVLGLSIPAAYLWTLVTAFAAMAAITAFLRYTDTGLAMRVAAEDPDLAQLLGVNIRAVSMLAWMAACGLGAMTGVLFASSVYLSPYMMGLVILKAFAAIIVGGMGSVLGVFVGGLCLGLLESLVAYLLSPLVQDTVPLVVIVLVLMLRPEGLFSRMPAWRA